MDNLSELITRYRRLQLVITIMNDIFRYFIICSHAAYLLILSMLFFGVVRLWRLDPVANLMYPLCAVRCGFEALTPLDMAGKMNLCSGKVLRKWNTAVSRLTCGEVTMRQIQQEQRSLNNIQCKACSFYTFQKSTVISSIDGCIQLTVNLLVTFG